MHHHDSDVDVNRNHADQVNLRLERPLEVTAVAQTDHTPSLQSTG